MSCHRSSERQHRLKKNKMQAHFVHNAPTHHHHTSQNKKRVARKREEPLTLSWCYCSCLLSLQVWLTLADQYLHSISIDWDKTLRFAFNERSNPDDDSLGIQIVKVTTEEPRLLMTCRVDASWKNESSLFPFLSDSVFPSTGQSPFVCLSVFVSLSPSELMLCLCNKIIHTHYLRLLLVSRTCTGRAAVPTAARRGSRTGWCWRGCCSPTPAGTKLWATAKDSTSSPLSSWRLPRATRATHSRYTHPLISEDILLYDVLRIEMIVVSCPVNDVGALFFLIFLFRWWFTWSTKCCQRVTLPTIFERCQVNTQDNKTEFI